MTVAMPTSGIADVQARVDAIRARIASVSPAARTAVAPTADAPTGQGAFSDSLAAATGSGAPGATTGATASPGVGVQAASASSVAPAGDWAQKLPAAGQRFAGEIQQAATEAGIDPALLAALVKHESGFDPGVRSHAGAIGLAQLMPGTAAGLGVDPTDPLDNLRGGARYLREQLDRFGSEGLALAAYNAGPNRVAQAGGIPRIAETQAYVPRVLSTWEQLR